MKVILVGNGSSVVDYKMGEYIDSEFDLVYRINRFKTEGFEKYVGSRVDGWFLADTGVQWLHNPTPMVEGSTRVNEFEYVFICMPKFKHNPNGLPLTEIIQLLPTDIEDKINEDKIKIHKTIGEYPGFKTKSGWEMIDREGIICNV